MQDLQHLFMRGGGAKFSRSCRGIVSHSFCNTDCSCGIVADIWQRVVKSLPRNCYKCSMGFSLSMCWNSFILQELCASHCTVRFSVVVHEERVRIHSTCEKNLYELREPQYNCWHQRLNLFGRHVCFYGYQVGYRPKRELWHIRNVSFRWCWRDDCVFPAFSKCVYGQNLE